MGDLGSSQLSSLLETVPGLASVLRSPVADAIVNVVRAGAGLGELNIQDVRELVQYATRRGLIPSGEGAQLLEEAEAACRKRKAKAKAAKKARGTSKTTTKKAKAKTTKTVKKAKVAKKAKKASSATSKAKATKKTTKAKKTAKKKAKR